MQTLRILTGNWYLKKTFWGTYTLMVEVTKRIWDDPSYGNGGGSYSPEITSYEKAKEGDAIDLKIKIN